MVETNSLFVAGSLPQHSVSFAPGKLYIAGEYAVVEPGHSALLVAVNRGISVEVWQTAGPATQTVSDPAYGAQPVPWSLTAEKAQIAAHPHDYLSAAITIMEQYRRLQGVPQRHYSLRVTSTLTDADGVKYGLGSSAAVAVAVVQALCEFYGFAPSVFVRYQLAMLASVTVSSSGSGGDLAASCFGGWVYYESPNRKLLVSDYATGGLAAGLRSSGWDNCVAQPVCAPTDLRLLIGWTGSPASTETQVADVLNNPHTLEFWHRFVQASSANVKQLVSAFADSDFRRIRACVATARELLQRLAQKTGVRIETPLLQQLCDTAIGQQAAAKLSGAGGGDCGIALAHSPEQAAQVLAAWAQTQIKPLDLQIHL